MSITNLSDPEIQKEPHKKAVEPRQALDLAINMVIGMRNQHQVQQHKKTFIPASLNTIQYPPSTRSSNSSLSNNFHSQGNRPPLYSSNCAGSWLPSHRDKCITKGKTCKNCGLLNYFAKFCRKQKNRKPQNTKTTEPQTTKRSVNTLNEESHTKIYVNLLHSSQFYDSDYSSGEENMVATIQIELAKKELLNLPIIISNISTTLRPWKHLKRSKAITHNAGGQQQFTCALGT